MLPIFQLKYSYQKILSLRCIAQVAARFTINIIFIISSIYFLISYEKEILIPGASISSFFIQFTLPLWYLSLFYLGCRQNGKLRKCSIELGIEAANFYRWYSTVISFFSRSSVISNIVSIKSEKSGGRKVRCLRRF